MRHDGTGYGPRIQACTICGEEKSAAQVWFLLTESPWEDKLRVLQWHDEVAEREGMYQACCPAHVEELVIHWMTTGSLDFPFATTATMPRKLGRGMSIASLPTLLEPDTRGARQLGELAVHRESMGRLLNESPDSLQLILDELTRALQRESSGAPLGSSDCVASGMLRPA
jgi:hypothetical protein